MINIKEEKLHGCKGGKFVDLYLIFKKADLLKADQCKNISILAHSA